VITADTRNLILANAAATALALVLRWPLDTLLWPYWIQSVIIGWYSRRRILALHEFSTDGLTMNNRPVPPTPQSLRSVAWFFTFHYGFFHFVYLVFLINRTPVLSKWDWLGLIAAAASFAANHRVSFRQNLQADALGRPNLGTLMFLPYARIVPMHLTIILGSRLAGDSALALLLFASLKTGADVLMHHVEHRVLRRSAVSAAPVS
jgi:hypothetical protein